jgi:hypothetical protein
METSLEDAQNPDAAERLRVMKTRALIIGKPEMKAIIDAISNARLKPVPKHVLEKLVRGIPQDRSVLKLRDRPRGWSRKTYEPQQVLIEDGYRCMFSFEEQPAGLCRHLSISVDGDTEELLPSRESAFILAQFFGFAMNDGCRTWIEEYEPGKMAVNFIALEPKLDS